ncbi:MAG: RelB/DinJ family addiction module antitoxin [Coriobacteriia bacterium]|nr:RelB/DinJ family addiction module antitoxin [Coriobacteriia bacterium]
MDDAMVTGRMSREKKDAGNAVLARCGMNASQAINALYDRLIEGQSADFLEANSASATAEQRRAAAQFLDSLVVPLTGRFATMTLKDAKAERLAGRA